MAGAYPNDPGWRVPWHVDGALIGNNVEYSAGVREALNGESAAYQMGVGYGSGMTWIVIFARLMDIDGWLVGSSKGGAYGDPGGGNLWSPNTTNGSDGTWNAWAGGNVGGQGAGGLRSTITAGTIGGVRAIRGYYVGGTGSAWLHNVHVYGEPTVTDPYKDQVLVWQPSVDERVGPSYFDLGYVSRGSTEEKTFRVKNVSPVKIANSIVLSFAAAPNNDASPSVPTQYLLSSDGENYYGTLTLPSLGPGAISSILYVRRVTPTTAALGPYSVHLKVAPATWT